MRLVNQQKKNLICARRSEAEVGRVNYTNNNHTLCRDDMSTEGKRFCQSSNIMKILSHTNAFALSISKSKNKTSPSSSTPSALAVCSKTFSFSSVQFDTLFNTRFSEVVGLLEKVEFQSTPKLSFGGGGRTQMFRKTLPGYRSGNTEISFAEFRCCSRHGQISTFHRTETGSAREIRRRIQASN